MAKLTFALATEGAEGGKAQSATAMLILPAPTGTATSLRSSYSREYTRAEPEPEGEGTATWLDKSVPATRVTAIVRTRDDGRLWISYSIEMFDDAGTLASGSATTPAQRLVNGASLSGQVILPAAGGKATVGELKDRKGRKLTVDLDGAALDVN
jgi:hypothetical protein